MIRTKSVPKRTGIRRCHPPCPPPPPPRQPYTKFKIKTLLPQQKTVQIKKKWASDKNDYCQKKNKNIYRLLGKNVLTWHI